MSREREEVIRERAYALWEEEGRPEARELDNWLRAEAEVTASMDHSGPGIKAGGVGSNDDRQTGPLIQRPRVEAYVDEAGEKGLLRNLDPSSDDKIAVLAGIAVPGCDRERFRGPLAIPFERFKAARPLGVMNLRSAIVPSLLS